VNNTIFIIVTLITDNFQLYKNFYILFLTWDKSRVPSMKYWKGNRENNNSIFNYFSIMQIKMEMMSSGILWLRWWWRHYTPLKQWSISTRLHGTTFQKTSWYLAPWEPEISPKEWTWSCTHCVQIQSYNLRQQYETFHKTFALAF
jgi:hypothetical protein